MQLKPVKQRNVACQRERMEQDEKQHARKSELKHKLRPSGNTGWIWPCCLFEIIHKADRTVWPDGRGVTQIEWAALALERAVPK